MQVIITQNHKGKKFVAYNFKSCVVAAVRLSYICIVLDDSSGE